MQWQLKAWCSFDEPNWQCRHRFMRSKSSRLLFLITVLQSVHHLYHESSHNGAAFAITNNYRSLLLLFSKGSSERRRTMSTAGSEMPPANDATIGASKDMHLALLVTWEAPINKASTTSILFTIKYSVARSWMEGQGLWFSGDRVPLRVIWFVQRRWMSFDTNKIVN